MTGYKIRPCRPEDMGTILSLVKKLAAHGGDLEAVTATEADYHRCFFGPKPTAESLVAEIDKGIIGYAVFFTLNSTFSGIPGLFLEDLYVEVSSRGQGIGKALFLATVRTAHERGYTRVEWKAYDWNTGAIDFYKSLGAEVTDDQRPYKLHKEAIARLV